VLALPSLAAAQTAPAISPAISTPDKVETRIGTLETLLYEPAGLSAYAKSGRVREIIQIVLAL
jgi:hypothetical protein